VEVPASALTASARTARARIALRSRWRDQALHDMGTREATWQPGPDQHHPLGGGPLAPAIWTGP